MSQQKYQVRSENDWIMGWTRLMSAKMSNPMKRPTARRFTTEKIRFGRMCVDVDVATPRNPGVYCYRIHGQIYHATSYLYANFEEPRFAQVYILDTEQAERERAGQAIQYQIDSGLLWALHRNFLK